MREPDKVTYDEWIDVLLDRADSLEAERLSTPRWRALRRHHLRNEWLGYVATVQSLEQCRIEIQSLPEVAG